MKIGELAVLAACDVQTVWFYERESLLEVPSRDESGHRQYEARHLERVRFIRHCRELDLPLSEVRQLLEFAAKPSQSCAQVNELLDGHISLVKRRIAALKSLETQLLSLRETCDGDTSHPCAILQSFVSAAEDLACACHSA